MRLVTRPMAPCRAGCVHSADGSDARVPCDRAFVMESWISSYRRSPHAGLISMDAWHEVMAPTIAQIIDRPGVRTIVAADADAQDEIANLFGWLSWMPHADGPLVFYVYVKHAVRYDIASRTGPRIATRLFRAAGIDPRRPFLYACNTHAAGSIAAAGKIPRAKWRPLEGRFPKEHTHGQRPEAT